MTIGVLPTRFIPERLNDDDVEEPEAPPTSLADLMAQVSPETLLLVAESWGPDWESYL